MQTAPAHQSDKAKSARSFADVGSVVMALEPSYPVFCLRPRVLDAAARRFMSLFPGTVLYAVKCNPHPMVLDVLYQAGIRHFDTASLPEIAQVHESYPRGHAYFMHPVKGRAVIKNAYTVYGIRHYVVDHASELDKVLAETGGENVVIIVRLHTPPVEAALYHLAAKFGAEADQAVELLRAAKARGCDTGLAFHVGSQCRDPSVYGKALALCGEVIARAGVDPVCLDVGGGFPASYANMKVPPLEEYMDEIRAGLKKIALKPTDLYINDGIYGSLSEMAQVDLRMPARLIRTGGGASETFRPFVLNGPTCDSLDVLPGTFELPEDVREGDWIEIG